jgi:hypothetical protein
VPQVDPARDIRSPLHGGFLQYGPNEAPLLLGDLLGKTRPNGAASQGELRCRGRVGRECGEVDHLMFARRFA